MDYDEFCASAFDAALKNGCNAAEAYCEYGEGFSANVLDAELDSCSVSRRLGLNLRVQFDGKNGYAYTEALENPDALALRAIDNAKAIDDEDEQPMCAKQAYTEIQQSQSPIFDMNVREKLEKLFELERITLGVDPRVMRTASCALASASGTTRISNTLGLDARQSERMAYMYVSPIVGQNGEMKDGFAFRANARAADAEGCAREAVNEALMRLGAAPAPTGRYPLVLRFDAAASLLASFSSMFSADAAQKGLSLLAGREGERIAAECVSLVDDPFAHIAPRAFDAEGVPSRLTSVIRGGVLETLLHNLKTAKKAGTASTGNAGRRGAASPIGVAPSHMYIENGDMTLETLLLEMGNGILITDVSGLHAGVDPISGEFSVLARGLMVENGALARPVENITVGGSFLELMKNVSAVGSDMTFGIPSGAAFASPSLLISGLMVSGA